jgi:hypothetical protein
MDLSIITVLIFNQPLNVPAQSKEDENEFTPKIIYIYIYIYIEREREREREEREREGGGASKALQKKKEKGKIERERERERKRTLLLKQKILPNWVMKNQQDIYTFKIILQMRLIYSYKGNLKW